LWGGLSTSCWWLLIAVYLFLAVNVIPVTKIQGVKPYLTPVFHCIGWGVPALLTLIPLAATKFGYSGQYLWCFFTEEHELWELGCFYVPVLIIISIGTTVILVSCVKIVVLSFYMRV
jgi:hypothetical protein